MTLAITTAFHDGRSVGRWLRAKATFGIDQNRQNTGLRPSVQEMTRDSILNIRQGADITIECLEGSIWVTLDGEMRDQILDAGDTFKVDSTKRILIQALDTARVRLLQPSHAL